MHATPVTPPRPIQPGKITNQQGGFSPFMFGLVMGMSIFSALSVQWARQELEAYQQLQTQRAQTQAEEIAKGMEFAILAETGQTYSDTYDLERARTYSQAQARTRGGQDYMIAAHESNREFYGQRATTVAIAGTDDTLVRSQIYRTESERNVLEADTGNQAVALYDTSLARNQQVRTSNRRMEQMAEQVYTFYAGYYRFPTDSEYQSLKGKFALRDAWGRDFNYMPDASGQKATLSFTTPWDYTQTMNLSLKDEQNPAE